MCSDLFLLTYLFVYINYALKFYNKTLDLSSKI